MQTAHKTGSRAIIVIDLPYIRLGSHELWAERVSPRQRGKWFDIERDAVGTTVGLAWWDIQINSVR